MSTTQENRDRGLYLKYRLSKSDGRSVNPEAEYFVLRLDEGGNREHVEASRKALKTYAKEIGKFLPKLQQDIMEKYFTEE